MVGRAVVGEGWCGCLLVTVRLSDVLVLGRCMDLGVAGNTALLTASSSGLGKASAKALAREGANVVINGRDADRVGAAVEEIREDATGSVVGQPGDITDPDDIRELVATTVDEFGGIDHLVTSAGGPPTYEFLETEPRDWYEAYDLLVMSVVSIVYETAEYLQADGGGSIVGVTSASVKQTSPTNVLSSSVRMAVIGLMKTLSHNLAPDVRVNTALPGAHETPRIRDVLESSVERGEFETYEEARAARGDRLPLGRIGDPMEFGDTVAYLSSERAGYITGVALQIDGGRIQSAF